MNTQSKLNDYHIIYQNNVFKDTRHFWFLSKTSLVTWCISTYAQNNKLENLSSIGHRSRNILMKGKTPLSHHSHRKFRAFRCLISRPRVLNQVCGNLLLSRKLRNLWGSCFSQYFILSTSPFTHNQEKFYDNKDFLVITNIATAFKYLALKKTEVSRWGFKPTFSAVQKYQSSALDCLATISHLIEQLVTCMIQ